MYRHCKMFSSSKYVRYHLTKDAGNSKWKFLRRYFTISNSISRFEYDSISLNTKRRIQSAAAYRASAPSSSRSRVYILQGARNYSTAVEFTKAEPVSNNQKNKEWMTKQENINDYTLRTHSCGELRLSDVNKQVRLYGWVEFIRMNKFILLRDYYGTTQIMMPISDKSGVSELHIESVVCVTGIVRPRPSKQIVKHFATGEIEVHATSLEIINNATPNLPFHIRDYNKANFQILNRYRYLALRFRDLQDCLRVRSEILFRMREHLITKKKFVEIETPTLFKKTPGGAQEFIVPTHEKNKFYSLVQSPQQLKQLLMIGSVDRYFQIARCYRDEKTTGERQPEFTQLDVELSFTNMEGVIKLTEDVLAASWPSTKTSITVPFPRMQYQYAIENYGSDKPCLLDKFLIQNLHSCIHEEMNDHVYMFTIPDGECLYEKLRTHFELLVREDSVKVYVFEVPSIQSLCDSVSKIISGFDETEFQSKSSIKDGDLVVLAKGRIKHKTLEMLGLCRHRVIDELQLIDQMNKKGIYELLWVVDFPLFEEKENGEIKSAHHPFTHPYPEDIELISKEPLKARGLSYDLVLNGSEIGGGSIRIHNLKLQEEILKVLSLPKEYFSHMLEALQMGCPPHGGIALGIDRLIAILCNRKTIKDVIAFPKGTEGQDFMTDCPSDVPLADKIRYHIQLTKGD